MDDVDAVGAFVGLLGTLGSLVFLVVRVTIVTGVLSFLVWLYCRVTQGKCKCMNRLDGKTVLITGGSTGIGYETARVLAARGARVIFTCRDMQVGEAARKKIVEVTSNPNVFAKRLDLCSLTSVRQFAEDILSTEEQLHIFINNAGRAGPPVRTLTGDGFETTVQSNHLGPFLLTHLLLDLIKKSAPSRIIVVSSMVHSWAKLDIDDFFVERNYNHSKVYGVSKLLNIYFARELADRLRGEGVTVNALHPGLVKSQFFRDPPVTLISKFLRYFVIPVFAKSSLEGAQTTIHLALAPELQNTSGKYFMDCKEAKPSSHVFDPVLQRKAWQMSEKVLGLS
ncbi:unnamed protein product, partial [Ixodes hexagonus]